MKEREVLKLALDWFICYQDKSMSRNNAEALAEEVVEDIKEVLAQPEQEPVGEAYLCDRCHTPLDGAFQCPSCGHGTATKEPVYTTPPQRKPLTRGDLWKLWCNAKAEDEYMFWLKFARAIEAAHGIKE